MHAVLCQQLPIIWDTIISFYKTIDLSLAHILSSPWKIALDPVYDLSLGASDVMASIKLVLVLAFTKSLVYAWHRQNVKTDFVTDNLGFFTC